MLPPWKGAIEFGIPWRSPLWLGRENKRTARQRLRVDKPGRSLWRDACAFPTARAPQIPFYLSMTGRKRMGRYRVDGEDAQGRIRTCAPLREAVFKTAAIPSFATWAPSFIVTGR